MKTKILDFAGLAKLLDGNKAAKFISLTYRRKPHTKDGIGELARHTILLNVKRNGVLRRDLAILESERPKLSGIDAEACQALIDSVKQSIAGDNELYTKKGYYQHVGNGNAKASILDVCYINGFAHAKKVLEPGTPKPKVNSRPLTVAKNKLRKKLKMNKFREFRVTPENFLNARVDGNSIIIDATRPKLADLPPVTLSNPVTA